MEALAQRLVDVINTAGPETRPGLRQYAIDLLREGTEVLEAGPGAPARGQASPSNPLGIALLLGMFSLPMLLLFFPVGLTLLGIALVLGIWGLIATVLRR